MRVLAVGTVMVDVLAVDLPRLADPGEVVYAGVETAIGGHPIDVVIDLAKLGYPLDEVAVVAAIGEGPYGSFARSVIDHYGVVSFLQEVPDRDTGKNVVVGIRGEDRRFHIDPGANWVLSADHVVAALDAWRPGLVTLRPGYTGIDLDLERVLSALDDTLILLDLMQPHPSRPQGYLRGALGHADLVHCNEAEAMINTGARSLEAAVAQFIAAGVEVVLVTAGDRGAHAFTSRGVVTQPAFEVEAVDATGCGDAFCAGAIRYLARRGSKNIADLDAGELADLLLEAQAVGASAATAPGCVAGVSSVAVEQLLGTQGKVVRNQTRIVSKKGSPS